MTVHSTRRNLGAGSRAVAQRQQSIFGAAIAVIRIRFRNFDDVTLFARNRLLANPHIRTEFGAPQSLGEDAR